MRVGAVDLGTNSTRLLVADVADGRVDEVLRRLTITRLGEAVDSGGTLLPAARARVRDCLDGYRRELDALDVAQTLAIGTSALRDAENGAAFLSEIERDYGFSTRLLSGAEEAVLALRGVSSDREVSDGTLVLDIGGGSTELIVTGAEGPAFSVSLQLGCVRLTERFLTSDPPTAAELERCVAHVREQLPALEPREAIGVSGTVTTVAALDLDLAAYDSERIHGHRLGRAAVERQLDRLARLTAAERAEIPTVEPGRAQVLVAGVVILREVLIAFGLDEIEASERDILHGAALAAAELP